MGYRYEKEYEVHYYEVDARLECNVVSIINFLCDIGTKQSEELGVGIEYCTARNLAWVFYKYEINVIRYPKYGEKLKIITEPKGFKKFYATRTYEIYDEENNKIVEGEALFLLIDIVRRRAVRVPDETYGHYGVTEEEGSDIKITRLEKLAEEMHTKEFSVRYSDIDSNHHVNNSKYLEWALEVVPVDIVTKYKINNISVVFEKECSYGTNIKASCEIREGSDGDITILHKIESEEGVSLTSVISKWNIIR